MTTYVIFVPAYDKLAIRVMVPAYDKLAIRVMVKRHGTLILSAALHHWTMLRGIGLGLITG